MFVALAFLPVEHVSWTYSALANDFFDDHQDGEQGEMTGAIGLFLDYFERTWVGRQRVAPRYAIELLNCNAITLERLPRTTNSSESWHHAFSSIFSTHHPNPYKLLDGLLREQVRVDFICSRLEAGETVELYSRADYRQANERLLTLIGQHHEMDPGDFLRSCCSYIHLSP
ncbi:hypothetical protein niasHT_028701 [Heterodera trifolii]|uniref:Uncharacterized protein n=1 Tax=Heterodera trifolii TaxID=157864 RepID=A0ABD2JEB9_9BILA